MINFNIFLVFLLKGKEWDLVSPDAKDLVRRLLVVDSSKRLSTSQALRHRWIVKQTKRLTTQNSIRHHSTIIGADSVVDLKILNMMKNFRASSKFKTEVMKILVNLLNEKEIESLKIAFK